MDLLPLTLQRSDWIGGLPHLRHVSGRRLVLFKSHTGNQGNRDSVFPIIKGVARRPTQTLRAHSGRYSRRQGCHRLLFRQVVLHWISDPELDAIGAQVRLCRAAARGKR